MVASVNSEWDEDEDTPLCSPWSKQRVVEFLWQFIHSIAGRIPTISCNSVWIGLSPGCEAKMTVTWSNHVITGTPERGRACRSVVTVWTTCRPTWPPDVTDPSRPGVSRYDPLKRKSRTLTSGFYGSMLRSRLSSKSMWRTCKFFFVFEFQIICVFRLWEEKIFGETKNSRTWKTENGSEYLITECEKLRDVKKVEGPRKKTVV